MPTLDQVLPGPAVHDPANQVISSEELRSLVGCLSTALSELESRVLSLYLDGCSYEQVGEHLACDTKTVDNALQRVKRKVGAHLEARAVAAYTTEAAPVGGLGVTRLVVRCGRYRWWWCPCGPFGRFAFSAAPFFAFLFHFGELVDPSVGVEELPGASASATPPAPGSR